MRRRKKAGCLDAWWWCCGGNPDTPWKFLLIGKKRVEKRGEQTAFYDLIQ
jgi:hypothetical protein